MQRYGSQFYGAAIGARAFRMPFQQVAHLFSNVVEVTEDYYPPACELRKITNDTIAACDALDGREDGVVSRTDLCKLHYNVTASVGTPYACAASTGSSGPMRKRQVGGGASPAVNGTVSAQAARIAQLIDRGLFDSQGRHAYVSYQLAAGYGDASTTYNSATGHYEASASGIGVQWVNYFLEKTASTSLSLENVTYDALRDWMVQGTQEYADTVLTTVARSGRLPAGRRQGDSLPRRVGQLGPHGPVRHLPRRRPPHHVPRSELQRERRPAVRVLPPLPRARCRRLRRQLRAAERPLSAECARECD